VISDDAFFLLKYVSTSVLLFHSTCGHDCNSLEDLSFAFTVTFTFTFSSPFSLL